jgi:hypothetical protein
MHICFALLLSSSVVVLASGTIGVVWPSCEQSRPTTTLMGTNGVTLLTVVGPANDTLYQPPVSHPPFTAVACNVSGVSAPAVCVTPANAPASNTYATVAIEFVSQNTFVESGTQVTVSYSVQFIEDIDTYNLFLFGFELITFLGDEQSLQIPTAPAFALSTGSLMQYFNYPDWDSLVPMSIVYPLQTDNVCDSFGSNENSTLPCAFRRADNMTQALRSGRFDVVVVFNLTTAGFYVTDALVTHVTAGVLFNLTNLPPRWSLTTNLSMTSPVLGFVSARSPFQLWNLFVTAQSPNCPTSAPTPLVRPSRPATTFATATPSSQDGSTTDTTTESSEALSTVTNIQTATATPIDVTEPPENLVDGHSAAQPVDETPLFIALLVVFGVICCVVLMCTVLRKRIRRSAPVRAIYNVTPSPLRAVCCYPCRKLDYELGAAYEEGKRPLLKLIRMITRSQPAIVACDATETTAASVHTTRWSPRSHRSSVRRRGCFERRAR